MTISVQRRIRQWIYKTTAHKISLAPVTTLCCRSTLCFYGKDK